MSGLREELDLVPGIEEGVQMPRSPRSTAGLTVGATHPHETLPEVQTWEAGDHDFGFGHIKLQVLLRFLQ